MSATHGPPDDFVATFQIDGTPVRGRVARLGAGSVSPILHRHDYPDDLARILGEACVLAALIGSSLKVDGRILVQAEGDGPVGMMVAEYRTDGTMRAYARFDRARWDDLARVNKGGCPHMPQLFGPKGALAIIVIQDDPNTRPYQGVVPLLKATMAECAADYFERSEQVPTRIHLALAEHTITGAPAVWRGGGLMVQKVAGDRARGQTDEAWRTAEALVATLSDTELVDPDLPTEALLYRLFHEQGVRIEPPVPVTDSCTCNEERLIGTLTSMPDNALRDLVEPDGALVVDCQFCNRAYRIPIERVTDPAS